MVGGDALPVRCRSVAGGGGVLLIISLHGRELHAISGYLRIGTSACGSG